MQPSFPANTKQAASMINGILTDVTSTTFSDKIMITITQDGRLAHWVLL
jgi:proteasome assembly chaperone 3